MFAIVDCNNFYASCERVFNPKLEGKPVVVLSNNDGCVIARSNEAKVLGIKMGDPAFMIEEFIAKNNIHVFSSNYALYGDLSERVMNTLATLVEEMEIYSIDEAFLNLHGFDYLNIDAYVRNIRKTVKQWTGIPVSIGVAKTKTLAKLGNRFVKKEPRTNGVAILDSAKKIDYVLNHTPVEDVWGVGRQFTKLLNKHNIKTAMQLTQAPDAWIRKEMSVVGLRTVHELRGIPCIDLELHRPDKKNICNSRSFGSLTQDIEVLKEATANFAARCAESLRRQKSCAKLLTVFVTTNRFRTQDNQYVNSKVVELPTASNSTPELIHYAHEGLKTIFRPGFNYKKAGIIVSGIVPSNQLQQSFFDTIDRTKHAKLMNVMDQLNSKIGRDHLRFAAQGFERRFRLRQEKLTPNYTGKWDEILTIKI